jgi:ABC-type sugar transport system permease subunit
MIRQTKRALRTQQQDQKWLGLSLVLPAILAVMVVVAVPFLYSLYLSLQRRDLARPQNDAFIGLENYTKLFSDRYFVNSLEVTLVFAFISVVIELVLGVAIALVLNEKFAGRGFLRGLIILPWALPSIVNAAMWQWIFNANYGALNALAHQLGLIEEYQVWLSDPDWAMALLILTNVWKETPFTAILVLAGLQGIPDQLYDAAKVDGASIWQRFTRVTLPLLRPVIMVCGLLQVIWSFQTFELVYVVTQGGPFGSTDVLPVRIYETTFRSLRFGYGASMAYLTGLVLIVPAFFYIRAAYRSIVEY